MSKIGANEKGAAPRNSTRDARGNMSAAALKAGGVETYFGAGFWLTLEFCQTVNKFRILANDGAESSARANLGEWETLSAARTAFSEWRKYLEKHERQIVESRARIVREVTRKIRGKASV